jgi:hypothetical protein
VRRPGRPTKPARGRLTSRLSRPPSGEAGQRWWAVPTLRIGESAQGNCRTVVQDNRWDGGFLDSLSQVAQESPISQQLSWPRTHPVALERCEAFNLNGAKVAATGIVRFVEGRTKLQPLELTDVPLRNDDLANLQQLTDVRVMSLRATMVTGKGVRRRLFPDTHGDHFAPTAGLAAAFADSSFFRHSAAWFGLLVSSKSCTNRAIASASHRRANGVVSSRAPGCGLKPA